MTVNRQIALLKKEQRFVNLSHARFEREDSIALAKYISATTNIESLVLYDCQLGSEGVRMIIRALSSTNMLKKLDLTGNGIGDYGMEAVAEFLVSNATISELYLGRNSFGAEGLKSLGYSIERNGSLKSVNLEKNRICGLDPMGSLPAFMKCKSLTNLFLGGNGLSSAEIASIEMLVRTTPELRIHGIGLGADRGAEPDWVSLATVQRLQNQRGSRE